MYTCIFFTKDFNAYCVTPAHTMYIITIDAHMSYIGVGIQHSFEEQRGQVGSVVHNKQQLVSTFNARYAVFFSFFKTVLSSGYILILLIIEYILASLTEMCQG